MASVVDLIHVATMERGVRMIVLARTEYGWQSSVRQADGMSYRVETHSDPITALKASLIDQPEAVTIKPVGPLTYTGSNATPGAVAHDDLFGPL